MRQAKNKVVNSISQAMAVAPWTKSIAIQVLIPVMVIGALALSSMFVSMWMTLSTQHDAGAINEAGKMRMQSYRLGLLLERLKDQQVMDRELAIEQIHNELRSFYDKLYYSNIVKVVDAGDIHLQQSYRAVAEHWEESVQPSLRILAGESSQQEISAAANRYIIGVVEQVARIDKMVSLIQLTNEDRIELLGMYEGLSIFLSLLALLYIVMKTDQKVVGPLKDLVVAARHAERGDFHYRTYYRAADEVGLLCQAFDELADSVAESYRELENRVEERTEQLRRTNSSLDYLYKVSQRLSVHRFDDDTLAAIVVELQDITGIRKIALHRAEPVNVDSYVVIGEASGCHLDEEIEETFPLQEQDDDYGFLRVVHTADSGLVAWQYRLIRAVGDQICSALALQYQEQINHRLMLFEERQAIARELHDSLAQSLSYQKLQLQRLARLLQKNADADVLSETIADMNDGMNVAYKHLRELLTTFRMKVNAPTLTQALHALVEEFNKYSEGTCITLESELDYSPLTPNEDIHVLQVVREALNNAIKHAEAEHVTISCQNKDDQHLCFVVCDDGVGMADTGGIEGHYGLSSMQERAEILGSELHIESNAGRGVCISLCFTPLLWRQSENE